MVGGARAVLAALSWALVGAGAGARYVDYSGAKMPEYVAGIDYDSSDAPAPSDDYRAHPSDAHEQRPQPHAQTHLDYKYEEETDKIDKPPEASNADTWSEPVRNHKKTFDDSDLELKSNDGPDEIMSKYKSNHRILKHRPKSKSRTYVDEDESRDRFHMNEKPKKKSRGLDTRQDYRNIDHSIESPTNPEDDGNVDFEDDKYPIETSSARAPRRKARDRFMDSNMDDLDVEDRVSEPPLRTEFVAEEEQRTPHTIRPRMHNAHRHEHIHDTKKRLPPLEREKRLNIDIPAFKSKPIESYDDFGSDYYDMRRVLKTKIVKSETESPVATRTQESSLPTSEEVPTRSPGWLPMAAPPESPPQGESRRSDTNFDYGHYFYEGSVETPNTESTTITITQTPSSTDVERDVERNVERNAERSTKDLVEFPDERPWSSSQSSASQTSSISSTGSDSLETKAFLSVTQPLTTSSTSATASSEFEDLYDLSTESTAETQTPMSLAEKSRLSILKKAQRKEMVKDGMAKKPPVLMQVTNNLHTLVMVEPGTTPLPWQRVREVSYDTPENLQKVKRLMRRKLVNNAKDIRDLTDNWDDMVCDYIDMSLVRDYSAGEIIKFNYYCLLLLVIAFYIK